MFFLLTQLLPHAVFLREPAGGTSFDFDSCPPFEGFQLGAAYSPKCKMRRVNALLTAVWGDRGHISRTQRSTVFVFL